MFVVHARRLQPDRAWHGAQAGAEAVLAWTMWGEPFIAASFLFIVGFSLVLSRERAGSQRRWLHRLLARALLLYGFAVVLFVPHYGLALPDLLLSPGILSAIAVAVAANGCALATAWPRRATGAVAVTGLAVAGGLEWLQLSLPGLNAGPGGAVPLLTFTAVGALLGQLYRAAGHRAIDWALAASVVPLLLVSWSGADWTQLHLSLHPDYGGEVALAEIFTVPATTSRLFFWNHTVAGCLGLFAPLLLVMRLLMAAERWLQKAPASALTQIGRHALVAYVGHLIVLGVLDLTGLGPRSPGQTFGLVALLATAAAVTGTAIESRKRRPTSAPDRASVAGADSRR